MTIDIHKAIISNPISKNILRPWGSNSNPNSLRGNCLTNILDQVILFKKKLIFTHIRDRYIKFMIHLQVITIDAQ